MNFIVKDLMITVFPSRPSIGMGGCDAGPTPCACSGVTPKCGGCSENPCTSCSSESKGLVDIYSQVSNPNPIALAALKNQLKEALAVVEARERVVLDSMRPQTAEEIELLQTHLTAAIEELKKSAAALKSVRTTEGSKQR